MCRLVGYVGPSIPLERIVTRPRHSLLQQSQHADEAKLAVNGDGFGMAWYVPETPEPGLYRDVQPAWSDANLASLCRVLRSELFLAHVRAGTTGGTSRANCHPFTHGRWSFAHNGQIGDFGHHRRALEATLPDWAYALRQGSADSELLFLMLLANGLDDDAEAAITATLAQVQDVTGPARQPTRITCLLSDGARLLGVRHASDGRTPTLYLSRGVLDHGGRALASEPLDGCPANWVAVPDDTLVTVTADGAQMSPLRHLTPASAHPLRRDTRRHISS
ncbi:class II glutamine amidotransferase [Jannaschia pagri]|uniref:Class II glutamine amidotransferase n=1 Tax=Jannaschia pagri TaxID=2829797 RepID=A0ABQ4NQJ5_9RHOB|nr:MULTISPECIES: class II glutamine amidotransferase [unclassified Jannaschia]GIT92835.1 class II glutamine amidotransferase [Jannaschia sp. AI_61]GIT96670.1 class II glutamine amidotransferase [Jannaschia sp. AI_62]